MFKHVDEVFGGVFPGDIKETIDNPEFLDFPNYGDLLTKDEFLENVKYGAFIDYDGEGRLATESQETNWCVWPSIANSKWPEWATHVMWYNR